VVARPFFIGGGWFTSIVGFAINGRVHNRGRANNKLSAKHKPKPKMNARKRDHSLGDGVYYAAEDSIGVVRRIVIILIDLTVIILAGITLAAALTFLSMQVTERTAGRVALFGLLLYPVLVIAYLTVIKASRLRTIGYRMTGTKIVDVNGRRPSFFRMLLRLSLWLYGPIPYLDLFWVGVDPDGQAIRDRFAGTCVVRNRATPAGRGEIHLVYYFAGGYLLFYPRVTHCESREANGKP
jgi:uncharacterized RDD family membrane protein YckC